MCWLPRKDIFHFESEYRANLISSRLLDYFDILRPSVSKANLVLHKLWILKLHWAESIPLSAKSKAASLIMKSLTKQKLCATEKLAQIWARVVKMLSRSIDKAVFLLGSKMTLLCFVRKRIAELQV